MKFVKLALNCEQNLRVDWHESCDTNAMLLATSLRWQFKLIEYAVRIRTALSGIGQDPRGIARKVGGPSRNRTGVHGFAVRCVTTPPSGPAEEAFGGSPRRLSTGRFDEWGHALPWRTGPQRIRDHLKRHCVSGI